ncbi:MAG: MBL fold metallo-hydrolase [Pseudomonadota bacterium]
MADRFRPNRRVFLKGAAGLTAAVAASAPARAQSSADSGRSLRVETYASDIKDVDSVNTHWFDTDDGLVLVDGQRLLPEAERAIAFATRTGRPIAAIFVTHAHTDHYGGLPAFRDAFPDVAIYSSERTRKTIEEDTYGFNAARRKRHKERFATQAEISSTLPNRTLAHGQVLQIGGVLFQITELTPGEADSTAMLHLPEYDILFPGDFVQNGKVPMPFHSHETWFAQLEAVLERFPERTQSFQGHGKSGLLHDLIFETREYLMAARNLADTLAASVPDFDEAALQNAVDQMILRFPHHVSGGGNPRDRVVPAVLRRIASQIAEGDEAAAPFAA